MTCEQTCKHTPCIFPKCVSEDPPKQEPGKKIFSDEEVIRRQYLENGWEP